MTGIRTRAPLQCPCEGRHFETVFRYDHPPPGETAFAATGQTYRREVLRCALCGHFVSECGFDPAVFYSGEYVQSTYSDAGMACTFARILALDPSRSDNAGRVARVIEFAGQHFAGTAAMAGAPSILDVGSGLCVFLYRMKEQGWRCTALDPDPRAARHARERAGVESVCADFLAVEGLGRFDVVTFNKVLEHVEDPVTMLARAHDHLRSGGFVYVEVPDGEAAVAGGPGREEFFVEHLHVFSVASLALLAARARFSALAIERLREPSSKYTLRAFLTPAAGDTDERRSS
jgi:SAM-dependent methyltransferase